MYGQTGCGKTVFILDLLEGSYTGTFQNIVILCTTVRYNKSYNIASWVLRDSEVFIVDPDERLHDYMLAFSLLFAGQPTLYVIDDCAASKALAKMTCFLSLLSVAVTQSKACGCSSKSTTVLKGLREQTRWDVLFYCKGLV